MSDRLTLVVFKDHLSSRTLTVRLAWLRAFALALLSVIGLAIIAAALFFNAYRKTLSSSGVATGIRVEELEKDLAETRLAYESVKQQALNQAGDNGLAGAQYSFSLLPAESVLEPTPSRESLPFRLEKMKAEWKGQRLQIRSAIEYFRDDGGNQQGHFIILTRGGDSLAVYPDGAFTSAPAPVLIRPEGGEFFSVSRYREIKGDLGPFARRNDVTSVEIFIFDPRKRLIFHERTPLESLSAKAEPAPSQSLPRKVVTPTPPAETAPSPEAALSPAAEPSPNEASPAPIDGTL